MTRVATDLYETFLDPTHSTPDHPSLPAVPERDDDTFWPDSGTSDSEGALEPEGANASEEDPNDGLRRRVAICDELDVIDGAGGVVRRSRFRRRVNPNPKYTSSRPRKKNTAKTVATCLNYESRLQDHGRPRHKRAQYLAGGNPYRILKDSTLENARLHALKWEKTMAADAESSSA